MADETQPLDVAHNGLNASGRGVSGAVASAAAALNGAGAGGAAALLLAQPQPQPPSHQYPPPHPKSLGSLAHRQSHLKGANATTSSFGAVFDGSMPRPRRGLARPPAPPPPAAAAAAALPAPARAQTAATTTVASPPPPPQPPQLPPPPPETSEPLPDTLCVFESSSGSSDHSDSRGASPSSQGGEAVAVAAPLLLAAVAASAQPLSSSAANTGGGRGGEHSSTTGSSTTGSSNGGAINLAGGGSEELPLFAVVPAVKRRGRGRSPTHGPTSTASISTSTEQQVAEEAEASPRAPLPKPSAAEAATAVVVVTAAPVGSDHDNNAAAPEHPAPQKQPQQPQAEHIDDDIGADDDAPRDGSSPPPPPPEPLLTTTTTTDRWGNQRRARYRPGERVEARWGGRWHAATTCGDALDGRIVCLRWGWGPEAAAAGAEASGGNTATTSAAATPKAPLPRRSAVGSAAGGAVAGGGGAEVAEVDANNVRLPKAAPKRARSGKDKEENDARDGTTTTAGGTAAVAAPAATHTTTATTTMTSVSATVSVHPGQENPAASAGRPSSVAPLPPPGSPLPPAAVPSAAVLETEQEVNTIVGVKGDLKGTIEESAPDAPDAPDNTHPPSSDDGGASVDDEEGGSGRHEKRARCEPDVAGSSAASRSSIGADSQPTSKLPHLSSSTPLSTTPAAKRSATAINNATVSAVARPAFVWSVGGGTTSTNTSTTAAAPPQRRLRPVLRGAHVLLLDEPPVTSATAKRGEDDDDTNDNADENDAPVERSAGASGGGSVRSSAASNAVAYAALAALFMDVLGAAQVHRRRGPADIGPLMPRVLAACPLLLQRRKRHTASTKLQGQRGDTTADSDTNDDNPRNRSKVVDQEKEVDQDGSADEAPTAGHHNDAERLVVIRCGGGISMGSNGRTFSIAEVVEEAIRAAAAAAAPCVLTKGQSIDEVEDGEKRAATAAAIARQKDMQGMPLLSPPHALGGQESPAVLGYAAFIPPWEGECFTSPSTSASQSPASRSAPPPLPYQPQPQHQQQPTTLPLDGRPQRQRRGKRGRGEVGTPTPPQATLPDGASDGESTAERDAAVTEAARVAFRYDCLCVAALGLCTYSLETLAARCFVAVRDGEEQDDDDVREQHDRDETVVEVPLFVPFAPVITTAAAASPSTSISPTMPMPQPLYRCRLAGAEGLWASAAPDKDPSSPSSSCSSDASSSFSHPSSGRERDRCSLLEALLGPAVPSSALDHAYMNRRGVLGTVPCVWLPSLVVPPLFATASPAMTATVAVGSQSSARVGAAFGIAMQRLCLLLRCAGAQRLCIGDFSSADEALAAPPPPNAAIDSTESSTAVAAGFVPPPSFVAERRRAHAMLQPSSRHDGMAASDTCSEDEEGTLLLAATDDEGDDADDDRHCEKGEGEEEGGGSGVRGAEDKDAVPTLPPLTTANMKSIINSSKRDHCSATTDNTLLFVLDSAAVFRAVRGTYFRRPPCPATQPQVQAQGSTQPQPPGTGGGNETLPQAPSLSVCDVPSLLWLAAAAAGSATPYQQSLQRAVVEVPVTSAWLLRAVAEGHIPPVPTTTTETPPRLAATPPVERAAFGGATTPAHDDKASAAAAVTPVATPFAAPLTTPDVSQAPPPPPCPLEPQTAVEGAAEEGDDEVAVAEVAMHSDDRDDTLVGPAQASAGAIHGVVDGAPSGRSPPTGMARKAHLSPPPPLHIPLSTTASTGLVAMLPPPMAAEGEEQGSSSGPGQSPPPEADNVAVFADEEALSAVEVPLPSSSASGSGGGAAQTAIVSIGDDFYCRLGVSRNENDDDDDTPAVAAGIVNSSSGDDDDGAHELVMGRVVGITLRRGQHTTSIHVRLQLYAIHTIILRGQHHPHHRPSNGRSSGRLSTATIRRPRVRLTEEIITVAAAALDLTTPVYILEEALLENLYVLEVPSANNPNPHATSMHLPMQGGSPTAGNQHHYLHGQQRQGSGQDQGHQGHQEGGYPYSRPEAPLFSTSRSPPNQQTSSRPADGSSFSVSPPSNHQPTHTTTTCNQHSDDRSSHADTARSYDGRHSALLVAMPHATPNERRFRPPYHSDHDE